MVKAIGYIRISDEDQSHYSLDYQKRGIQEYCLRNDLTLLKIFEDNGQSSYTFDRKAFNDLEDHITKDKPQYLIVYHLDRFSRNMAEAMIKVRELFDKGIRVRDLSEPIDLDDKDPNTFLLRSIKFMSAEMELHRIHERTKSGIRQAALNGRHTNRAPYGYKNAKDGQGRSVLEIDEEKAFIVRIIFREFLNNLSFKEVANVARRHGYKQTGNSAIKLILQNNLYAGLIRVPGTSKQGPKLIPGLHVAIVSEQDYWLAQEKMYGPVKNVNDREEVPLRGVLRCWCGAKMTAGNSKSRSGKYYWYYLCSTHRQNFNANRLHMQFEEMLSSLTFSESQLQKLKDLISKKVKTFVETRDSKIKDVRKHLDAVEMKIEQAEKKYLVSADISEKTYLKVTGELKGERTRLYQNLARLNTNEKAYFERLTQVMNLLIDLKKSFAKLPIEKKHQFIEFVFDKQLSYEEDSYRTSKLLDIFEDNLPEIQRKGLLKISSPVVHLGDIPDRAQNRSLIEHLDRLAAILIA